MKTKQFEFGAICDIGNVREVNQDNILIKIGEDLFGEFGLFLVADGIGSMDYSQMASEMIIDEFRCWWNEKLDKLVNCAALTREILELELEKLVMETHFKVVEKARLSYLRMGSTLSALFIYKNFFIIKHVGDSRIYVLRKGIEMLTIDHSYVAEQLRNGLLTIEEAEDHPGKNVLTQCIGMKNDMTPYSATGTLKDNDIFLLCSDGLYNMICEEKILIKLEDAKSLNRSLQDVVEEMLEDVKKNGALDNVSIILIKYKG